MEKDTEDKRKKPKGKEPSTGQPSGSTEAQPGGGEAEQVLNEIIRESRAGGGEDLFPTSGGAMDEMKRAFCGASFVLPKFKHERYFTYFKFSSFYGHRAFRLGVVLHFVFRIVAFTLKEGVPVKDPKDYTKDDFVYYMDRRNGYRSPRPLLCVREAEYNQDGSFREYVRDKQYDTFLQNIQRKIYQAKSKAWTQGKRILSPSISHHPLQPLRRPTAHLPPILPLPIRQQCTRTKGLERSALFGSCLLVRWKDSILPCAGFPPLPSTARNRQDHRLLWSFCAPAAVSDFSQTKIMSRIVHPELSAEHAVSFPDHSRYFPDHSRSFPDHSGSFLERS